MAELFAEATKQHFRFKTPHGDITTEDLWDLPLQSATNRANLDDLAKALNKQLKETGNEESFVKPVVKKTADLQMRFDVVKSVIDVRVAERDAAAEAATKKEKKQKLMALIEEKKEGELKGKTTAELEAMLNSL